MENYEIASGLLRHFVPRNDGRRAPFLSLRDPGL
jgi:hypothetical protein